MSDLNFEITNHPSQARHGITNEPLFDKDGNPVPLFPDEKSLRLDGTIIAYITAAKKLLFIRPESVLSKSVCDSAREFVASMEGDVAGSHQVAEPPEQVEIEE